MIARITLLMLLSAGVVSCVPDTGPPVTVTDLRILAPLPGSSAGVAYFRIDNRSANAVTVNRIVSPQYDDVQMHETTIEDGVSRMRAVDAFQVEAKSSVDFTPGGKHVMLMRPSANVMPGTLVALEFRFDEGLLIVSATMQNRLATD